MLSKTFSVMVILSFVSAIFTGNFERMSSEFVVSLSDAVYLCISLVGMMCFWSGLMNVLKQAGAIKYISRLLCPLLKLIYGKNVLDKQSIDNLSASVSANFLRLGNAALPIGIETVKLFEKNNTGGYASDATIMFAVLNTVPFQLLPTSLIAMRSKYASVNPFDVVPYIWFCSVVIIVFAILMCKLFSKFWRIRV